jgi:hypothetical protein
MGSGGVGTAIGRKIIVAQGLTALFLAYGLGLLATLAASAFLIRDDCPAAKPLVELPDQA